MAEFEWTRPAAPTAARTAPLWLKRLAARLTDWEDWLTLVLALGATMCVSLGLEQSGWSDDMPPITVVAVLAIVASLLIARSGLSIFAAWPLAVLTGALVVFWQTLEMVGPGDFQQRLDTIYLRFETWFNLAFHGGVSNDSLPFNVLVLGLTWLGAFIFGWSVYRWQNAWIGLIPGGLTLFLDMALVGDNLEGSVLLYMLFGFLLVMRTNLMTRMTIWRREGTSYPSLISLSFLNFTTWAVHHAGPGECDGQPGRGDRCQLRAALRPASRKAGGSRPQLHGRPTLPGLDRPRQPGVDDRSRQRPGRIR